MALTKTTNEEALAAMALSKVAQWRLDRRLSLIERGLCVSCTKSPTKDGKTQCPKCRKRWRERAKQKRDSDRQIRIQLGTFNVKPKKGTVRPCEHCGKDVYVTPSRQRRFCSQACSAAVQFTNRPLECAICGKQFYVSKSQEKYRNRETCSLVCRSKLQRRRAVERRTREGYTKHQLDRLARYSPEADAWRKAVFDRDNYTCQECCERGGTLEADHIKPWAFFPDLRFELSNGRTLCRRCHDKTKMSAKKMREIYGIAA